MLSTDDYLSFILSFPNASPLSVLNLFLLGFMRIAPIVGFAPFLGSKLPNGVKIGLVMTLTAIMLPSLMPSVASIPQGTNMVFAAYALKELSIGFILAFLISIPFYIAQASGVLIDFQRGSSSLMVMDPIMQAQVSPLGLLYNYIFIVMFYEIGGPFIFLQSLAKSYTLIPVSSFIAPTLFNVGAPLWHTSTALITHFTALSIQLAAPSLVAILMAEMFLGIANRMAPQVQIAFLGMALKSLIGIALLWAAWFFILQQVGKESLNWLQAIDRLLPGFAT